VLAIAEGDATARYILLDIFSDEPDLTLDLTYLNMFHFPNFGDAGIRLVFSGIRLHGGSQPTMPVSQVIDGDTFRFISILYPPQ
jgi:hypothetical protein